MEGDTRRRHTEALLQLARRGDAELADTLTAITETVSTVLGVERVGVWFFDEDRRAMRCADLYVAGGHRHERGYTLDTDSYPSYFRALEESRTIDATDAQHDPRTSELTEGYLRPIGITSMLDVPCWRGGRVVGVVCHEHVGPPRRWTSDEYEFATSVADMVSLALEADERRRVAAERERLVEQLGRERRLLEQVLRQMPSGVIIVDRSGRVVLQNGRAEEILGVTVPPDTRDWHTDRTTLSDGRSEIPLLRALRHGEVFKGEEVAVALPDGRHMWLSVNAGPVRDETGGIVAAVAAFTDVTDKRRAQEQLTEEAIFRERFMAVLGHDLRTPASAVLMSAQLMQRLGGLASQQGSLVERIISSARRMERMISELLDFARIGGGRMPVVCREVDLSRLCEDVLDEIRSIWTGRELRLSSAGDLRGEWDPDRLAQVVTNLVGNALTHGSEVDPVDLRLDGQHDEVTLAVSNRGPRIPDEVLAHLFEPFRGSGGARGGLGLGLFITRAIVSAHGGDLAAQSDDALTTFTVTLPRRCPPAGGEAAPPR